MVNSVNQHFFSRRLRRAVGALVLFGLLLGRAQAQLGLPPSITVQPLDQVALNGDTVQFSVTASSLTALSYQWYFGTAPIGGATASLLTLTGLDTNDAGAYFVEVRNLVGAVNSRRAQLTVLLMNDIPAAKGDAFTTAEDTLLTIPVSGGVLTNDTDLYPGTLGALLVSGPRAGTLNFSTNGAFTYQPGTNFNGTDEFTYRATDGMITTLEQNTSGGGKMEINQGTGAQSFRHGTAGDPDYTINKLVLRLSAKSGENNNLNFCLGTGMNSGPLAGSGRVITMASISNKTDGVSFQNYDIFYSTPVGPFTAGITYYLNFENSSTGGKKVYVEYASSNTYAGGTYYQNGSNIGGDMRFEIKYLTVSEPATVTIDVTPVNDAPVAVNDSATTPEDTSVTLKVLANDSDLDGDALIITSLSSTNAVVGPDGLITFAPGTNFNGTQVFTYTVSDGSLSATGTVTVTVTPVADLLIANPDTTNVLEDASVTIRVLMNDVNVDGGTLRIASLTANAPGSAVISASGTNILFAPATNFFGTVVLGYTITNAAGTATGLVTVTVTAVNDAPVARPESYVTADNTPLTMEAPGVLQNDTDVDNAALSAVLVTGVAHGVLSLNTNGSFTYTPASNYYGGDSFTYRVSDGASFGGTATVSINTTSCTPLRFISQQMTTNGFRLQLAGPAQAVYTILRSTNTTTWTPIATNVAWSGAVTHTDQVGSSDSLRFYGATVSTQASSIVQQNVSTGSRQYLTAARKGAQSFRHGTAGGPSYTISMIHLHLSRSATIPNTNFNLSIGTGTNSGALAGSSISISPASITNSTAGVSFQDFKLLFATPVGPFTAGTTYYLNVECEAPNLGRIYLESTGVGTAYTSGIFYRNGAVIADDLVFETWGQ